MTARSITAVVAVLVSVFTVLHFPLVALSVPTVSIGGEWLERGREAVALMAFPASGGPLVCPHQREAQPVIEPRGVLPCASVGVVAALALLPQDAAMSVLVTVAVRAVHRDFDEGLVSIAVAVARLTLVLDAPKVMTAAKLERLAGAVPKPGHLVEAHLVPIPVRAAAGLWLHLARALVAVQALPTGELSIVGLRVRMAA